jgi:tyrosyl-tRNA synthetase
MEARQLLSRGIAEVIDRSHLEARLKRGDKLTVKLGIDPTGSSLHLGHALILRRLREFARAGHHVIFIIGDFTAQVGDPSDQSAERQPLTSEEIEANMADWLEQVESVLGKAGKDFEVRYNSEWLAHLTAQQIAELMKTATWQQLSGRADFKKRITAGKELSMLEMFYPLLQGYDSVAIRADLEVGGTDQTFNLLMGRQVQKRYGLPEQDVMTFELLEGTDGKQKMSKSAGNFIALKDEPAQMYGKVMSIPDSAIGRWFLLTTDLTEAEIRKTEKLAPRERKARLAREIVAIYHGPDAAERAEGEFTRVFKEKDAPADVAEFALPKAGLTIVELLEVCGLTGSKSEARRLIDQGGVKLDGKVIDSYDQKISSGLLQVGKRRFLRIT